MEQSAVRYLRGIQSLGVWREWRRGDKGCGEALMWSRRRGRSNILRGRLRISRFGVRRRMSSTMRARGGKEAEWGLWRREGEYGVPLW